MMHYYSLNQLTIVYTIVKITSTLTSTTVTNFILSKLSDTSSTTAYFLIPLCKRSHIPQMFFSLRLTSVKSVIYQNEMTFFNRYAELCRNQPHSVEAESSCLIPNWFQESYIKKTEWVLLETKQIHGSWHLNSPLFIWSDNTIIAYYYFMLVQTQLNRLWLFEQTIKHLSNGSCRIWGCMITIIKYMAKHRKAA